MTPLNRLIEFVKAMKLKLFLFSFVFVSSSFNLTWAQETIIEALETLVANEGSIEIDSDPAITALLGKPNAKMKSDSGNYDIIKVNGFRILVFIGNNPKKSKTEAFDRQNQIKTAFSDTETYITYDSPNWRVLVGDFITREEATFFKEMLQKEFPNFGKEMYIVADKINMPVEKTN
jgi:hypothetical protein